MPLTYQGSSDTATQKKIQSFAGAKAGNGDQLVIGPPAAGQEMVIVSYSVINGTAVSTTWQLKAGGVPFASSIGAAVGAGVTVTLDKGRELRLGSGNNLILNLSGANSHVLSILYYIDDILS